MSLGINLGAQNLGPNSWAYFSPIFVGQIPENILHPSKNNFMDPEPGFWDQNLSCTYREPNYDASLVNLWWICPESVVNLSWACPRCQQLFPVWRIKSMKIMNICLKWVHMARDELILKLDGALWLTIIFKPLLTPKGAIQIPKIQKSLKVRAKPAKQPLQMIPFQSSRQT